MATDHYLQRGPRVAVRRVGRDDYDELTALARQSSEMISHWLGARDTTEQAFESYVELSEQPTREGLVICLHDGGAIVGSVNINNIVRGTLRSGALGYTGYAPTVRRGYMTEGVGLVVRHAFGELGLHRLEANIQPDNTPSLDLVRRLGFRREGYSPAFQFINGAWRDHERWAITATTPGA
jgi:ribosomal-protein-alanine N-acetyltransferase